MHTCTQTLTPAVRAGTLPSSWGQMVTLTRLDVSDNSFPGSLPGTWSQLPALQVLNVSAAMINGTLPQLWLSPNLTRLDVSLNELTARHPALHSNTDWGCEDRCCVGQWHADQSKPCRCQVVLWVKLLRNRLLLFSLFLLLLDFCPCGCLQLVSPAKSTHRVLVAGRVGPHRQLQPDAEPVGRQQQPQWDHLWGALGQHVTGWQLDTVQ